MPSIGKGSLKLRLRKESIYITPEKKGSHYQKLSKNTLKRFSLINPKMYTTSNSNYVISLARAGILPNDFEKERELEEDIYDLMYGKGSSLQLIHALENSYDHIIIPVVLQKTYRNDTILQCGFLKKGWKKTARFCKEHKKKIIIGTTAVLG